MLLSRGEGGGVKYLPCLEEITILSPFYVLFFDGVSCRADRTSAKALCRNIGTLV